MADTRTIRTNNAPRRPSSGLALVRWLKRQGYSPLAGTDAEDRRCRELMGERTSACFAPERAETWHHGGHVSCPQTA
jgi:hypothetical protein